MDPLTPTQTIQDVKKTAIRSIVGARWLLGGPRRAGKTSGSVVIFRNIPNTVHVQEGDVGFPQEQMALTEGGRDPS